ncbi:MAG: DNA mismatch endonuclease Vsr [Hyphomonadaceae bacterium]|nr:DNA mismatch endonuclease Vsr [Hyphomonadaceae bacterium]
MTDVFAPEKRAAVMRAVKARDTGPELKVRAIVRALGHRYRLDARDLPGRPDIVQRGRRKAIFVHGCFWHGHDCLRGARMPKANADYWRAKIARNRARDIDATEALSSAGWSCVTVWECALKDRAAVADALAAFLGPAPSSSRPRSTRPSSQLPSQPSA